MGQISTMNPYKININGTWSDVNTEHGHSRPPGLSARVLNRPRLFAPHNEDEDEIYYVPDPLPQIEWSAYCSARQNVENYCAKYVRDYSTNNPGVAATFEKILMTKMADMIHDFCDQHPDHAAQYKMVFTDYANYIWNKHASDLDAPLLIYMAKYQDYYYDANGNGSYYDWFSNHGIKPTGNWQQDAQTARQRQADADDDMANAFGGMRVHSRLHSGFGGMNVAKSQASARSSAPQARRGGGRFRP